MYQDARIHGPYSREDMASVPGLSRESLVCPEGSTDSDKDWRSLEGVPELASLFMTPSGVSLAPAVERAAPESFESFRDAAHAALESVGGYAGEWVSGSFEYSRLFSPWEPMTQDIVDQEREEERGRADILEAELNRVRTQLADYERRQNEILERLAEKDRRLEEMQARLEERVKAPPPAPMPRPAPAPAPLEAAAFDFLTTAPAPRAAAPAPAPTPAAEPPPLPTLAPPTPFGSALKPPPGAAFTPPAVPAPEPSPEPAPAPAADAAPEAAPGPAEAAAPPVTVQVQPEVDLVILEEPAAAAPSPVPAPAPTPAPIELTAAAEAPPPVAVPVPEPAAPAPEPLAAPGSMEPPPQTGPAPGPMRTMIFAPAGAEESLISLAPPPSQGMLGEPPAAAPAPAVQAAPLATGWGAAPTLGGAVRDPFRPQTEPARALPGRTIERPAPKKPEPTASVPAPSRRRPPSRGFLAGLGVAAAGLALVAFFFLRDPKQVRQMVSMAPERQKGTSLGDIEPLPAPPASPAAPTAAQPAAQPAPSPAQPPIAAAPEPAPAAAPEPAPAQRGKDFVDSDNVRAIEMVKNHKLDAQRSTVAAWLQYSFLTRGHVEEWSAGGYEATIFYVMYRVFKVGPGGRGGPVVTYLFEADVASGKVTGKNAEARALLSGGSAARPRAKRAEPRARPRARRRTVRARPDGPEPLPGEDELAAGGGEESRFNNPGSDEEALSP